MFRRRRRGEEDPTDASDDLDTGTDRDADTDLDADTDEEPATPAREHGPWDAGEIAEDNARGRIDLGGLLVPGVTGLEVRVEADQTTGQVIAVTLVLDDGALQLQPFAAPRTEGIWDEVRAEIRAGITAQGGTADEVDGPLGTELRTKVPVRAQDGSSSVQPARFLGVDGPRWFLRGVLTGRPALETANDEALIGLFRDIVVVRGGAPMAPREPIPLTLPSEPGDEGADQADGGDPLNPFARGPEITEIR